MQKISFQNLFRNIDYDKSINYFLVFYAFCLPFSKAGVNIFETLILFSWILQGNWKHKLYLYKYSLDMR